MKKTRVWPALLAALVILAGCAAAPPEESDPPTEEFVFTRENMPRLNGSTSAVPLAEAVCSVLLGESREEVADLVQFSRTTASYEALMAGEDDLLLAGEPEQAVADLCRRGGGPDPLRAGGVLLAGHGRDRPGGVALGGAGGRSGDGGRGDELGAADVRAGLAG